MPQPRHHHNAPNTHAPDWRTYPPEVVPRFDLENSTTMSEEKFVDLEVLTNKHITHSIALREWMKQKSQELNSISGGMEQHHENIKDEKVSTADTSGNAERRKEAMREIQETYAAFVDMDTIGAHVSARRQASEALQRQRKLPLSETKRLLGSDGSSSCYSGPLKEKHLYLVGSPPKIVRLPFDQAVNAGLEDIHAPGGYAFPSSLPDTPQTQQPPLPPPPSSPPQASVSEQQQQQPPFLIEPSTNRSHTTTLHIPEWFDHFTMPLKGQDREAKWNDLTNRIYTLETKIRYSTDDEVSGTRGSAAWDKKWHEPNNQWAFPHQRKHGGWWKCRSGPDAPQAEARCRFCHYHDFKTDTPEPPPSPSKRSAREQLAELQGAIDEAMAVVGERDKAVALGMLRGGNTGS
ncbi:uncharacterized protein F4812DRAFT_280166 [Daldinia caldariorum]|uniref:uncharacterized protein n=1 Tax=Daldinia caldariorum TaxID=326644 RepID=UPI002008EA36|nr:uncharacterized protein F4812DRAFT_280166 [Daldinia caldariorum]KAI1470822.1 hypothetical protein F4812DRAFT_280166 [Daldinia caldariorum]